MFLLTMFQGTRQNNRGRWLYSKRDVKTEVKMEVEEAEPIGVKVELTEVSETKVIMDESTDPILVKHEPEESGYDTLSSNDPAPADESELITSDLQASSEQFIYTILDKNDCSDVGETEAVFYINGNTEQVIFRKYSNFSDIKKIS